MRLPSRALLVCLLFCIAGYLLMWRQVRLFDEGIILTGAMRVQSGDLLHRDFYANYGPAQFYIVAALFQLLGADIMVERAWDIVVRGGIVAIIYVLIAPRINACVALAASAVAAAWLSSVGNHGYPVYPALLMSLLAAHLLERSIAQRSVHLAMYSGLCVAATTLFRYDIGFFALVALLTGSLFAQSQFAVRGSFRVTKEAVAMTVTAGCIVFALLALYAASGALGAFYHDVIDFPAHAYVKTRSLPLPGIDAVWKERRLLPVVAYLSPAACFAGGLVIWRNLSEKDLKLATSSDRGHQTLLVLLIALTAMFYLKGFVRLGTDQLQLSLIASIPLLAHAWHLSSGRGAVRALVLVICCVNAASAAAFTYLGATRADVAYQEVFRGNLDVRPTLEPYREAAVRYVKSNSSEQDHLFVGLLRHDKMVLNDVSAYFMTRRMPATKWHQFDPGLQTSALIQAEIIRELENSKPPLVWVESSFDWIVEPNESALSSGITLLDDYLRRTYVPAATFGSIQIRKRKPE
jgi:hypothetical protein